MSIIPDSSYRPHRDLERQNDVTKRNALIVGRILIALLALAALIAQILYLKQLGLLNLANVFSYFTILSNVFLSIVFLVGAVALFRRQEPTPTNDLIRGAAAVAITIVGIVYGVLLSNQDLGHLLPWVNIVHHYITPVAGIADWLILPPKNTLRLRQLGYWLIYPLLYLVYTLIRGSITHFYPYFFLDPANGGYGVVALYSLGIFIAFLIVGGILLFLGNRLPRTLTN